MYFCTLFLDEKMSIKKILRFIFVLPIKFYRYVISPYTPSSCRHVPTCSEYAVQAVEKHGIAKGFVLGIKRLSKCHPWGTTGYDPVPPPGVNVFKFSGYQEKRKQDDDSED